MGKRKTNRTMTEIIQAAIRDSGLSLNEVGRQAGVDMGAISRFMRNERNMILPQIEKLCGVLGLELTGKKQRKGR